MCSGSRPSNSQAPRTASRTGICSSKQNDAQPAVARQFVQRGRHAAAGRIAHPAHARTGSANQGFDQRQHGARVGTQVGFEIELAARQQDGDAVIADRAGEQDLVAQAHRARIDVHAVNRAADAGGGDVHPVGLAVLDDLGVAAGDAHPRAARGFAMARTSASSTGVGRPASRTKVTTRASALAPETARSFTVPLTASSPIEPPGKRSGFTTKLSVVIAICAPLMSTVRGIAERFRGSAEKKRSEQAFDQPAAGLAAGAVRHLDLRIAETNWGGLGIACRLAARFTRSSSGCSPLPLCGVRSCNTLRMILPMKP